MQLTPICAEPGQVLDPFIDLTHPSITFISLSTISRVARTSPELRKKTAMPKVFLLLALLAALTACNHHPAASSTTAAAAAPAASSDDPAVPGPVSFSLTIDGTTVTGTTAGFQYNQGTTDIDANNQPEFRFILADIKGPDGKPTRTVTVQSPIKVVSHHVDCSGDDHFYGLMISFEDDNFDQYCGDDATLNITELSNTRVKGNFSGKFNLIGRPRQKTIKVDCTFDIPRAK